MFQLLIQFIIYIKILMAESRGMSNATTEQVRQPNLQNVEMWVAEW